MADTSSIDSHIKAYADLFIEKFDSIAGDWRQPWLPTLPFCAQNAEGHLYSGVNDVNLSLVSALKGYGVPLWLTSSHCRDLGVMRLRGESGTLVYWGGTAFVEKATGKADPQMRWADWKRLSPAEKEHYTDKLARRINRWKRSRIGKMYERYVKVPILTEGIRLDTVLVSGGGDFVYCYTQTIATRPRLRQVDIILEGDIYEGDRRIYDIPRSEPLSFYISSLSTFVDPTERYLTRVVERRVEANTACYVEFGLGKADVDLSLGHNATEIGRIRGNLSQLLENETFDLDSIVVTASCSPEGSWKANTLLSQRRSEAVSSYFKGWMRHYADSLEADRGVMLTVGDDGSETLSRATGPALQPISFIPHCDPENWQRLDAIVAEDTLLTPAQKEAYGRIREDRDPDRREKRLSREDSYRYFREELYPYLRTVRFDFHLHRKGMVKDTVHTTEPDTLYSRGVQAIRDRDYETALSILRPYADFNTAIAYCSLDYNASARAILEGLERDAKVNYMLALLYSREGDDRRAVECYLHAVAQEPTYRFRGNLDPEISALVKRYGLTPKEDDSLDDLGDGNML